MPKVNQSHFPRGINQYVPNMEFAADVVNGVIEISLGNPKAADSDGIYDDVATTGSDDLTTTGFASTFDGGASSVTSTKGMIDAEFGRCLVIEADTAGSYTTTVHGRDYLGQAVREDFGTHSAGNVYGGKAFKYIDKVTLSSAGGTAASLSLGWADSLGLPYKGEALIALFENDAEVPLEKASLQFNVASATLNDGYTAHFAAPIAGYAERVDATTTVATTSGASPTVTLENAGTAVTGLSLTISSATAIGTAAGDTITAAQGRTLTGLFAESGTGSVVFATTFDSGALDVNVVFNPVLFVAGVDTTTQTATTSDPRGTLLPLSPCASGTTFDIRLAVDDTDLHGVEHYNG